MHLETRANPSTIVLLLLLVSYSLGQRSFSYQCSGCDWPGQCQATEMQSPINILEYQSTCDVSHTFKFQSVADSADIEVKHDPSGIVIYSYFMDFFLRDGDSAFVGFNSSYIKFRMPAEHEINGVPFDLEMQITGDRKPEYTSKLSSATISILFNVVPERERVFASDPQYTVSKIFDKLDVSKLGKSQSSFASQLESELTSSAYYFYEGSRTEPNCEPHQWIVLLNSLYITRPQYERIKQALFSSPALSGMSSNSRKVQIKGDRLVVKGGVDCSTYFGYVVAFVFLFIFMVYVIFRLL